MFTGDDIIKERNRLGWSAQKLADHLETSRENIYKWQRGTTPTGEDYVKVSNWLSGNVSKSDFKPHQGHEALTARLDGLIEANRMMAAAMLADTENRARLTRSNEELTLLVKQSVSGSVENLEALTAAIISLRSFVVSRLPKAEQGRARKTLESHASLILSKGIAAQMESNKEKSIDGDLGK